MLSRSAKSDKLKRLREARRTGRIAADSSDEDAAIYDEVDEDTFRKHKRDQLMNDDFIVDDNGEGYVDNGVDEWDDSTRPNYYSDEEEPARKKKKNAAPKKVAKVIKTADINSFFAPSTGPRPATKPVAAANTSIDDILDDFDVKNLARKLQFGSTVKTKKKLANSGFSFSTSAKRIKSEKLVKKSETPIMDSFDMDMDESVDEVPGSEDAVRNRGSGTGTDYEITPEAESAAIKTEITNEALKEESESDDDDVVVRRRPRTSAPVRETVATISTVKAADLPSSSPVKYLSISYTEKLDSATVGDSDSFKMFWLDYAEADSSLLLFGKVLTKEGKLVSVVVQINGMDRELYVLPRAFRQVDGEDTDQKVSPMDVHEEIAPILMENYGLDRLRAKPETKKYAFELPGVPKDGEYLKILLPFKAPKNRHLVMPSELEGETFQRIFGTNANIFESFVLQRNIMGPCWLEIKNADFNAIQNASHCQVEVAVSSASCISPIINSNLAPPSLNTMAISVQTIMNTKANKQEVACITIATYRDLPQDSPIDEDLQPDDLVTLVRPIGAVGFPPGVQQAAQKSNLSLRTLPSEASMLGCLAALVKNADPDVLVGHRLENISLDVLVHRMHDLRVATWSAMGRRNRKAWPDKFGKGNGFNNNLLIREIFQGRLLCDIANELGQSLTPKCQSWDLPEMYNVVCHKQHSAMEINFQNPRYAEDASFLLMPLKENVSQVLISAKIAFALQILSLSKQLTNLAGNAWSHTLSGTRAGRNEYILLHEFNRNNYIVPDKEDRFHKNTSYQQEARLEANEDDATTVTSNKKPKYQGGLVFEPEKGLHKNFILVMDFNSLYPSIIQEFNICFTTVERDSYNISHDEERDLPSIPERDSEAGVLPRLLNTLVSRRREVKKLLKNPKITPEERAQYDIKQQALKLTANSMYGCLGYVNSRFYAKPLAMLVTNKGREILMDTRQLAELIGLRVVYGDTDSVMIDTGVVTLAEALKIGEEFKVQVNERYKLLEIDTDNVFKRLLLHAKKKYAAMNISLDRRTGKEVTALEVKGLDMRRREYCPLSKEVSTFVLEKLLSDIDPEQALSEIYENLEAVNTKVKNNEYSVDKYQINTRLSKDPNNYPNGKTMPPVQVALRLRKQGKVVKAGSVITFAITAPEKGDTTSNPAERARAIQEVLGNKSNFKPDSDYYLEKQIYAPVERLVNRIEGIDMMRVATALGIDTRKYVMRLRNTEENDISPLESNITDIERFRQSSYLVLECKCGAKFRFGGLLASKDYKITFNGVCCSKCDYVFPCLKLTSQLESMIRKHLALYYAGWVVCDDSACGVKTRQISVYGKRCIGSSGKAHGCKGVMRYKYTDKALYNQLLYFDAIFDVDKAKSNKLRPVSDSALENLSEGQLNALAEQNRALFGNCREVVDRYLKDCGRRYVNMKAIFEFMA
ncbi:CIC11C00000002055 [Sungouiella intermedia]|uniref:DNA polymerase n=1 Tax=Sungouiella intermedia TaxID=45354 RepID=A0A1L0D0V4_9ASCO|nr:CIC11C00000002055 [[Candida] intermedia]